MAQESSCRESGEGADMGADAPHSGGIPSLVLLSPKFSASERQRWLELTYSPPWNKLLHSSAHNVYAFLRAACDFRPSTHTLLIEDIADACGVDPRTVVRLRQSLTEMGLVLFCRRKSVFGPTVPYLHLIFDPRAPYRPERALQVRTYLRALERYDPSSRVALPVDAGTKAPDVEGRMLDLVLPSMPGR